MRIACIFFVLMLVGCASLPEAEYNEATSMRGTINKYELQAYAQSEYETAESKYKEGKELYDQKKKKKDSKELLTTSISNYQSVLEKGFPPYTESVLKETEIVKSKAEEMNASERMKEDYEAAKTVYDNALVAKEAGEYEKAVNLLEESEKKFDLAFKKTKVEVLKDDVEKTTEEASSIKADIFLKSDFEKAKEIYKRAMSEREAGEYEKAIASFEEAEEMFTKIYTRTKEKKEQVFGAINAVEEGLEEVENSAEKIGEEIESIKKSE